MIRNLFDTFSIFAFLAGMSVGLVIVTKFPITGMIVFTFLALYALVTLVNAASND